MSGAEKAEVLDKVALSGLPKRRALGELGVPKSTYYRWLRRKEQQGLEDDVGGGNPPWNQLTSHEVGSVLSAARDMPDLSCRQLAAWITDNMGFSVSESTVYRILHREGLVKRPEMRMAAGKEYHRKTTGSHQMWATDASYFRVVGCPTAQSSSMLGTSLERGEVMTEEHEGYRPELEEWRQPIAWKALMAALMATIVDLDSIPPQDRTTAGFLHQLTIRVGETQAWNIPALTLENEQQVPKASRNSS